MKFTEEYLVELSDGMNELYNKCENIIYKINNKIKQTEKDLINKGAIGRWDFNSVYMENPFNEEIISLFGDDNDFYMTGYDLTISGKTPNYEDGCMNEAVAEIPYKWLELEDDELNNELDKYIDEQINKRLKAVESIKIKLHNSELEKAKELISKLPRQELLNLLNEQKEEI